MKQVKAAAPFPADSADVYTAKAPGRKHISSVSSTFKRVSPSCSFIGQSQPPPLRARSSASESWEFCGRGAGDNGCCFTGASPPTLLMVLYWRGIRNTKASFLLLTLLLLNHVQSCLVCIMILPVSELERLDLHP